MTSTQNKLLTELVSTPTTPPQTHDSETARNLSSRLNELLAARAIVPHFHPVVRLADDEVVGFELLARSNVEGFRTPAEMFAVAEYLNRAADLSELCRSVGYEAESQLPPGPKLFVNVHPCESLLTGLLPSIRRMRKQIPSRKMVVEIHEAAVTDPATLDEFTHAVTELDVELAFDDFGIGRARLLELARIPPAYVKFDASLVRNIEDKPRHHRIVLSRLVQMVQEVGCATVAEGVETEIDAQNCQEFGFDLVQGYLYGQPAPVETFAGRRWQLPR